MDPLILENQLCFPLYAAARSVVKLYTPLLNQIGLTYTQYITMMVLWEKKSCSVKELGRNLYLDSGTLTPLLKKLEQQRLVSRRRSMEDERSLIVQLTPHGAALREKALGIPAAMRHCVPWNTKDAEVLYQLLYQFLNQLEAQ